MIMIISINEELLEASHKGRLDIIEALLAKGADVNYKSPKDKKTPLILAAEGGYFDCIETLIEEGAKVNAQDKYGNTALHTLCLRFTPDSLSTICLLLDKGAKVNHVNKWGNTPIMNVINLGSSDTQILDILINRGADINVVNKDGQSIFDVCDEQLWSEGKAFLINKIGCQHYIYA